MQDIYTLGFALFPGIGPVGFGKLVEKFGSTKHAWHAARGELEEVIGEKISEHFFAFKKAINLEKELEKIVQKHIQLVTIEDDLYPRLLREIPRSPFLLFVKGDISTLLSEKTIAIVGTRKITDYGRSVTEMVTSELVEESFTIVSGLAFGVDATAHKTAVKKGGITIAVLAGGVDICIPSSNQYIYQEILSSGGAIISSFPPGLESTRGLFPARNGLIAGISQAVVVTEGAADSGALITAEYAKKLRRPVFTVPGPITSYVSQGTNRLLQKGGIPILSGRDILDRLGIITQGKTQNENNKSTLGDTPEEQQVIDMLQNSPLHFDEIVRKMGKDSKSVGSLLSLMELKGMVKNNTDGKYCL